MGARFPHRATVLRGGRRLCLSIIAAIVALLALAMGGGNAGNFNAVSGGESFGPQTLIEHDEDLRPALVQFQATPTPAVAIVPTVAAVATAELPLRTSGNGECPAVIVETFEDEDEPAACAVAWCESRWQPHAVGDGGKSLGLFQLWTGWAAWYGVSVDALFDPATNAAVARAVLEHRGRWSGKGGWTCADLLGVP